MSLFCRHDWRTVEKHEMPSAFEQIAATRPTLDHIRNISLNMFRKKLVLVMRCQKCGRTRIHAEENP